MNFRLLSILILLFLNINLGITQPAIYKHTLTIVDTTDAEIDQAEDIYNWVITNIRYDVKAYISNNTANLDPEDILRHGKGICYDFANLYAAMCKSVNIECYVIGGYSKGYSYNKQKPFIRANHAWNIVNADSEWIHVDATWGSGYLDNMPGTFQKVLYNIAKVPYAKKNPVFFPHASNNYFDIIIDSLIKTHYPLDPKWLFNDYPLSFNAFENDSVNTTAFYPTFEGEIERVRKKSREFFIKKEGVNGNKYNRLNFFDLANGYFIGTSNYNLDAELTNKNLYQFKKYQKDYTKIINAIDKHKTITDSIYRMRSKYLRQVARDQKRLTGRIRSKTKKAQNAHKSSQKSIVGKSSSYNKKMNGYQLNIGRAEIKKIPLIVKKELEYEDTTQYNLLTNAIIALEEQQPHINTALDSILDVVDNFSLLDAQIDDSIDVANKTFKTNIDILGQMILTGQEKIIVDYVDSLKVIYKDIEDFLDDKKTAKSNLQYTGRAFYENAGLLQKNLKQQISHFQKLKKVTNSSDTIIHAYNACIDELITCYRKSIVFTRKLKNHNEIQSDLREENLSALKQQKKSITKENKFFLAWYDHHIEKEKSAYTSEKEIVKLIRSSALRNLKKVEVKIEKFETRDNQ